MTWDEADGHFQHLPMAVRTGAEHMQDHSSTSVQGATNVFGSREKAGFGGMITVSVILFAMQIITGVQAFPL